MNRRLVLGLFTLLSVFQAQAVLAQWSLDNDASTVSFVTVKAEHVAEVHTFDSVNGSLSSDGDFIINIELASVNTMIPIRNERMQEMLFETGMFPRATISGEVDIAAVGRLGAGESMAFTVPITLDLHGATQNYQAEIMATRTPDGVVATSVKPIVVSADNHNLAAGVEALREVAGLPGITRSVPVSFTVVFAD